MIKLDVTQIELISYTCPFKQSPKGNFVLYRLLFSSPTGQILYRAGYKMISLLLLAS